MVSSICLPYTSNCNLFICNKEVHDILTKKDQTLPFVFLKTLIISITGGVIAYLIHIPIPWLLGSMIAVLIASSLGLKLYWPSAIRDIAIVIVGYSIGLSFTKDAIMFILSQLPAIFLSTIVVISFCVGLAFVISKLTQLDFPSVLIGSIPGGLSQMLLLGEEIKSINLSIVTFLQVSRLILIIIFVPLFVFSPFVATETPRTVTFIHSPMFRWGDLFPNILLFIPVVILSIFIARKIKLPTPFLVGPIFATAIIGLFGYIGPTLPSTLLDASQLMIGAYIGLLFDLEQIEYKFKMMTTAVASGALLLFGSWGLSLLLSYVKDISFSTSALSLAPGGMDQMGIIAAEIHADLSIVAGYQLFRLFFIFFVVPPLLRWFIHYLYQKNYRDS